MTPTQPALAPETMTPQQLFDTAYLALIVQGRRSFDAASGDCLYRGPDGTKCAVGHLIDDRTAAKWAGASALAVQKPPHWFVDNLQLLREMQEAHDFCSDTDFRANLTRRFAGIAADHGLQMPEVAE